MWTSGYFDTHIHYTMVPLIDQRIVFTVLKLTNFQYFLFQARIIFEKASKVPYKHVDDLASVWCEWAEMEIRHEYVPYIVHLMNFIKQACRQDNVCQAHAHKFWNVYDLLALRS